MERNATRRAIRCVASVLGMWLAFIGMSKQHIPGLALAVIQDGKILRFSGYGVSNLERRTPVTAKTVFAIASVSKQFLAAGAMVLVQEGKLSLDDSVTPYLTDAPPNLRPITIRELLTHTSGLPGNVPDILIEKRFSTARTNSTVSRSMAHLHVLGVFAH